MPPTNESDWTQESKKLISVYVSGPITADKWIDVEANIMRARRLYWDVLKKGFAVYCPHTMSQRTGIRNERGAEYATLLANDLYWVDKCDVVLMAPGWENSRGAQAEYKYAQQHQKRIYLNKEDLFDKELPKEPSKELDTPENVDPLF